MLDLRGPREFVPAAAVDVLTDALEHEIAALRAAVERAEAEATALEAAAGSDDLDVRGGVATMSRFLDENAVVAAARRRATFEAAKREADARVERARTSATVVLAGVEAPVDDDPGVAQEHDAEVDLGEEELDAPRLARTVADAVIAAIAAPEGSSIAEDADQPVVGACGVDLVPTEAASIDEADALEDARFAAFWAAERELTMERARRFTLLSRQAVVAVSAVAAALVPLLSLLG